MTGTINLYKILAVLTDTQMLNLLWRSPGSF